MSKRPPGRAMAAAQGANALSSRTTDIVRRVMDDDQPPRRSEDPDQNPSGADQGWVAIGYLITGIVVWGGIGWLVDAWLDLGGIAIGIGSVIGVACGVYLIARRLGA
ncbi:MAG TPA: AtpZ/AtpI family protein [Stackebrandtia sp.]|uniref:AtpZ/AtpI family protein n=1 Tax=Stackebrandtia sp. TaxID=2023065 RepID=UPI002D5EF368|nr:AtpZ/AtpI family protein [Stackebrandtia sp.]HZE39195.1 AtpZ/AtpI family protein [Stackebrandtia sp.]